MGVDETSEFVRIFNNIAAQAFFTEDEDLKTKLVDVLYKLAQNNALMENKLCVKNGELICAEDWLDNEGQDKIVVKFLFCAQHGNQTKFILLLLLC